MARPKSIGAKVIELVEQGLPYTDIAGTLGCSKSTISYHVKENLPNKRHSSPPIYDWKVIGEYYDQGHSKTECRSKFGFSVGAWYDAIERGDINAREDDFRQIISDEEFFVKNIRWTTSHIRRRFLAKAEISYKCSSCELGKLWNGKYIALHVDHIDGDSSNNQISNLRWLCPNCHSQTDTYCGKNVKRRNKLFAA